MCLFVRHCEYDSYIAHGASPEHTYGVSDNISIAEKRQWMLAFAQVHGMEYIFMADDDLLLDHRRDDVYSKFKANYENPVKNDELLEVCLRICGPKYPMVHPRIRFHADTAKYRYEKNCAAIRFTCLHVPTLAKHGIRYDGLGGDVMEDRYVHHSLLSLGYRTIALGRFCAGDYGSNRAGGCSETRTAANHSKSAQLLHDQFPDTVKLKAKNNGNWDAPRLDCIQYLKKYLDKGEAKFVPKSEIEEGWPEE